MNEIDVFELLRKQEEEIRKPPIYFAYYDKLTYRIISLKNYLDETDTKYDIDELIKIANRLNIQIADKNGQQVNRKIMCSRIMQKLKSK